MNVRAYRDSDLPRLKELFEAQGFEYDFPDVSVFTASEVVADDADVPVCAIFARPTVELYFIGDRTWRTPGWRWEALQQLHAAMRRDLKELGVQDAHFWCPPALVKSFGRRLMRCLGWKQPLWVDFHREVG